MAGVAARVEKLVQEGVRCEHQANGVRDCSRTAVGAGFFEVIDGEIVFGCAQHLREIQLDGLLSSLVRNALPTGLVNGANRASPFSREYTLPASVVVAST